MACAPDVHQKPYHLSQHRLEQTLSVPHGISCCPEKNFINALTVLVQATQVAMYMTPVAVERLLPGNEGFPLSLNTLVV